MSEHGKYSVENAKKFGWSSITGNLHSERVDHLKKYLLGDSVLDAGCGGGAFTKYLAENGWKVTGLERSEEFLTVAQRADPEGEYVHGDVTDIPFADGSFDTVFCFDVIEHVQDELKAITELCRVAKKRVIIAVPAHDENVVGYGLTFRHYQDLTHLRTYTKDSLESLFHAAGQKEVLVLPELPVDMQSFAVRQLVHPTREKAKSLGKTTWQYARWRGETFVLRRLLARAFYRTVYSGWLAVVNL